MSAPLLEISGVTKHFGATKALDQVSLTVKAGQVHGLIGQNGAGKSTLVKTLAGLYPDHGGTIAVQGTPVGLKSPRESRTDGIAVIHQEFSLVEEMTVADNLLLGREPGRWTHNPNEIWRRAHAAVQRARISIGAPVDATVGDLSPGVRQRIEIVKAMADNVRVLVMDEPTARLTEAERDSLFQLMRTLASRGVGLVFVSHFLDEVSKVTQWLTVLRDGKVVASDATSFFSTARMAATMLGAELEEASHQTRQPATATDEPVFVAAGVSSGQRLRGVDVELRAGSIIGVAGLVGSGRTRLCRVLAGVDRPTSGTLSLRGTPVRFTGPPQAVSRGIALIPEDRKNQGLSMDAPLTENLTLMALRRGKLGAAGVVSPSAVRKISTRLVRDLQIRPADIDARAGSLSGGNQQKLVLGKALAADPEVLIVDQPTAGVDVGTKAQIHRLLRERADAGAAILVVSDDIDELYALSDRLLAMWRGEAIWQGSAAQMPRNKLVTMISTGAPATD